MKPVETVDIRFWSKVNKTPSCWLWTGAKSEYGKFWQDGKVVSAHRVAYELMRGSIPDGCMVLHHCDNPFCVNPDHLFLGNAQANVEDMLQKGRQGKRGQKGTRNNQARLHSYQIREIRVKFSQGQSRTDLANYYHVHWTTIDRILKGEIWSHVR